MSMIHNGVAMDFEALEPHPSTPPNMVAGVACQYSWEGADRWMLTFVVSVPPGALRVPDHIDFGRTDELWRTTCFELFLRRPGQEGYLEFNFAPSGQWAAYGFDGYRQRSGDPEGLRPIIFSDSPGQFNQANWIKLERMGVDPETAARMTSTEPEPGPNPPLNYVVIVEMNASGPDIGTFEGAGPWEASLSAVIEEADGTISYWALAHPSDKPDFHHPDSFVLDLP